MSSTFTLSGLDSDQDDYLLCLVHPRSGDMAKASPPHRAPPGTVPRRRNEEDLLENDDGYEARLLVLNLIEPQPQPQPQP